MYDANQAQFQFKNSNLTDEQRAKAKAIAAEWLKTLAGPSGALDTLISLTAFMMMGKAQIARMQVGGIEVNALIGPGSDDKDQPGMKVASVLAILPNPELAAVILPLDKAGTGPEHPQLLAMAPPLDDLVDKVLKIQEETAGNCGDPECTACAAKAQPAADEPKTVH